MLAELIAVFLFVSVIITVATDDSAPWKGVLAPVAIGGFIFVAAVTIGPTSGGSFNPARSIDPAIWAVEFRNLWIYIVGPLIGAAIAGGLSMAIREATRPRRPEPADPAHRRLTASRPPLVACARCRLPVQGATSVARTVGVAPKPGDRLEPVTSPTRR